MEIIIIFTCQLSHEYCYQHPRLLRGSSDSTQRRMLPLHYLEDQTAYRLLQLMMIMFQCFIGFPMCVMISQCLLTFHNFTRAPAITIVPTDNYDCVALNHHGRMHNSVSAAKEMTQTSDSSFLDYLSVA